VSRAEPEPKDSDDPNGPDALKDSDGSKPLNDHQQSPDGSGAGSGTGKKGLFGFIGTILRSFTYISAGDLFTLGNGILGFLALTYIMDNYRVAYGVAVGLLLLAIVADGLDGAVARRFGTKHHYGVYLDSIADTVSFCLTPAVLVYMLFYDPSRGPALDILNDDLAFDPRFDIHNAVAIASALTIGVMGMLRLARFSLKKEDVRPHFSGLPTPAMTMVVLPVVLLWSPSSHLESLEGGPFDVGVASLLACIGLGLCAILMVTELPYPKLRGKFALAALVSLVMSAIGVVMFLLDHELTWVPWVVVLGLQAIYTLGGPFTMRYMDMEPGALPPSDLAAEPEN